ncbi:hypothetical protein MTO96_036940, partial [Rhipicephalus appendiculatus]
MWLTGKIGRHKVALGLVYLWTGKNGYDKNVEILACMENDILNINLPILIVGDFNAHIEELDMATDRTGKLLLDWVEKMELVIVNTTEKCKGTITWAARTNTSCIDYCLISSGLLPQLTDMHVDENGEESIGSDHHSIKLRFGAQAYPTRLPGAQTGCRTLTDAEIEEVAGWMEEEAVQKDMETFDDFHTWIKNMIGKVDSKHRPSRGPPRQKRKAWWDNDVATALATCKQLCRQHRFALRLGADEAEVQDLWARYLRAKKSMSALVQDRMGTINRKILKEIKEAGRDAGKKFWRHIQGQKSTAQPWTDSLRDPEMGLEYRGEACLHFIAEHMAGKLRSQAGHSVGLDERPQSPDLPRCDSITERELDRALKRLSGTSAAGLDGIPPLLLKRIGRETREHLRDALNYVIQSGNIPREW